jgi:hypothetical protein
MRDERKKGTRWTVLAQAFASALQLVVVEIEAAVVVSAVAADCVRGIAAGEWSGKVQYVVAVAVGNKRTSEREGTC